MLHSMQSSPSQHFRKFLSGKLQRVAGLRNAAQEDQQSQQPGKELHTRCLRTAAKHPSLDALDALSSQVAAVYMNSQYETTSTNAPSSASTSEGTLSDASSDSDGTDSACDACSQAAGDDCIVSAREAVLTFPKSPTGLPPRSPDALAKTSQKKIDDHVSKKANKLLNKWRGSSKERASPRQRQNEMNAEQDEEEAIIEALQIADMAFDLHCDILDGLGAGNIDEDSDHEEALQMAEAALELHFQWLEDEAEANRQMSDDEDSYYESDTEEIAPGNNQTVWEFEAALQMEEAPIFERKWLYDM